MGFTEQLAGRLPKALDPQLRSLSGERQQGELASANYDTSGPKINSASQALLRVVSREPQSEANIERARRRLLAGMYARACMNVLVSLFACMQVHGCVYGRVRVLVSDREKVCVRVNAFPPSLTEHRDWRGP